MKRAFLFFVFILSVVFAFSADKKPEAGGLTKNEISPQALNRFPQLFNKQHDLLSARLNDFILENSNDLPIVTDPSILFQLLDKKIEFKQFQPILLFDLKKGTEIKIDKQGQRSLVLINRPEYENKAIRNWTYYRPQSVYWWYYPGWIIAGALGGLLLMDPESDTSPWAAMAIGAGISVLMGLLFEQSDWWNSVF